MRPIFETITAQLLNFIKAVERFGRFPHRNQALGRESTREEIEFLKSWRIKHPVRDYGDQLAAATALEKKLATESDDGG